MEVISGSISIRQIFGSPAWSDFVQQFHQQIRPSVFENVSKILRCKTEHLGFALRECECGFSKKCPFSCKSRFCSSCGKIACDNWMNNVIRWALPDMQYHHIVFTIPEQFRNFLLVHRTDGLNMLFRAASNTIFDVFSARYDCTPGIISVMHTFGADIKWNPHLHLIVTSGGLSSDNSSWNNASFIPFSLLASSWKYHVISDFRSWGKSSLPMNDYCKFNTSLNTLFHKRWYVNVGKKLDSLYFTIQYIGRYAKRPVIAETRIKAFDETSVSFSFKDKLSQEEKIIVLPIQSFFIKLIRHIPNKFHKMIRYSGIFSNRIKSKSLSLVSSLISSGKQISQYITQTNSSWRERIKLLTGNDPCVCSICSKIMRLTALHVRLKNGLFFRINFSP